MTDKDRLSFEAIAIRAAIESVNCYTVVSLGAQAYVEVSKCAVMLPDLKKEEMPAPIEQGV